MRDLIVPIIFSVSLTLSPRVQRNIRQRIKKVKRESYFCDIMRELTEEYTFY